MAKLYFYYSSMNAGKSATLIQSNYNYIEQGHETLVYIADPLNKNTTEIVSRTGLHLKTKSVPKDFDIFKDVSSIIDFFEFINKSEQIYINEQFINDNKISCIFVDEVQFLKKEQILQLRKIVNELNIPVLCYGLRTDYEGNPFEGSIWLLALADKLIELKSICFCGSKATMNYRKVKENSEQIVLDQNIYEAMCSKHFYDNNL